MATGPPYEVETEPGAVHYTVRGGGCASVLLIPLGVMAPFVGTTWTLDAVPNAILVIGMLTGALTAAAVAAWLQPVTTITITDRFLVVSQGSGLRRRALRLAHGKVRRIRTAPGGFDLHWGKERTHFRTGTHDIGVRAMLQAVHGRIPSPPAPHDPLRADATTTMDSETLRLPRPRLPMRWVFASVAVTGLLAMVALALHEGAVLGLVGLLPLQLLFLARRPTIGTNGRSLRARGVDVPLEAITGVDVTYDAVRVEAGKKTHLLARRQPLLTRIALVDWVTKRVRTRRKQLRLEGIDLTGPIGPDRAVKRLLDRQ